MANPYVNKVSYGGNVLIDLTGDTVAANNMLSGVTAHNKAGAQVTGTIPTQTATTVTPTRTAQTIVSSGTYVSGNIVVSAIPNTYYTEEEALNMFYPVGSIYMSTSSTPPTFGGSWSEITIPATWGDIEDGMRSYVYGEGTGLIHFWKRIS